MSSDLDEEGSSEDETRTNNSRPQRKKERKGWKKPKQEAPEHQNNYSNDKLFEDRNDDIDSDDSDSDDELGRNNESPVPLSKDNKLFNQRDGKYQPKMSEVVEETEPESSFKDTDKQGKHFR